MIDGQKAYGLFVECSFGVSLGKIVNCLLWKQFEHTIDVFVVHHSENNAHFFALDHSQLSAQILPSTNIVSCIANDARCLLDGLPASHESGVEASVLDAVAQFNAVVAGYVEIADILENLHRVEHRVQVLLLIDAAQVAVEHADMVRLVAHTTVVGAVLSCLRGGDEHESSL